MTGEVLHFRKRFIGGFNRDDVVAYISKISTERNEALAANEEYQTKVEKLSELVSENCMKREETERELAQLRSEISELREQLDNYKYLERESYNLVPDLDLTPEPEPTPEPEFAMAPPPAPPPEPEFTMAPPPAPPPEPALVMAPPPAPTPEPEFTMAPAPKPDPEPAHQESNNEKSKNSVLKIKLARKRRN